MDGTNLYQAVAAVLLQAFGIDLDLTQQLTIVLTATLASIGLLLYLGWIGNACYCIRCCRYGSGRSCFNLCG